MSRRLVWLLGLALGCPKSGADTLVDPTLPEEVERAAVEDPLVVLHAGADSLDPAPRARALALLVRHVGPEPWGRRAMLDPSSWVRRSAIEALAERQEPLAATLLEAQVNDAEGDPYVRGLAAIRVGTPAAAAMHAAISAEHEPWRVVPLALAAVMLGDTAAMPVLTRAIEAGELPMDLEFVRELGRSGLDLAPALSRAQERVEDELVLPVAAARLMLGDAAGEQPIRKALADADEERRMEALDFVAEIDHPAADALLRRARALGPAQVERYAELVLAARTGSDADVFERAYADGDREQRELAVRYAARAAEIDERRADRDVTRVIVQALGDADGSVRAEACRAVATLGLAEAREAVTALLSDEVEIVRIEASGTLLALGR